MRIYELYGSPHLPSTSLENYSGFLARVRAHTVKQAYFLLGHDIWAEDDENPGIVAMKRGKGERMIHWSERKEDVSDT